MNVMHKIVVSLSAADIIKAMQEAHPTSMSIQALPADGRGVVMIPGNGSVTLDYSRRPAPEFQ